MTLSPNGTGVENGKPAQDQRALSVAFPSELLHGVGGLDVATLPHGVGDGVKTSRNTGVRSMSRSNGSGASANVSMIEARAQSRRDSRRDGASFPKTDQPSHCQLAAVDSGLEDSKGLETGGHTPLMRNRAQIPSAPAIGLLPPTLSRKKMHKGTEALTFNDE